MAPATLLPVRVKVGFAGVSVVVTIAVVAAEATASALVAIVAVIEDPAARLATIAVCTAIVNDAVARK